MIRPTESPIPEVQTVPTWARAADDLRGAWRALSARNLLAEVVQLARDPASPERRKLVGVFLPLVTRQGELGARGVREPLAQALAVAAAFAAGENVTEKRIRAAIETCEAAERVAEGLGVSGPNYDVSRCAWARYLLRLCVEPDARPLDDGGAMTMHNVRYLVGELNGLYEILYRGCELHEREVLKHFPEPPAKYRLPLAGERFRGVR